MISEEGDSLLRFLNNISYQLACLLDVDDWPPDNSKDDSSTNSASAEVAATTVKLTSSRTHQTNRQQVKYSSKQQPLVNKVSKQRPSKASKKKRHRVGWASNTNASNNKKLSQKEANQAERNSRGEGGHKQADHETETEQPNLSINIEQPSAAAAQQPETIDCPLTLNIGDEITLGDQCSSISPSATHLSPLEPSIAHFGPTLHAQSNFYVHQSRQNHPLDSYQSLHEDFTHTPIGHETTIPIDNPISSPNSQQQQYLRQQQQINSQPAGQTRHQQQLSHRQQPCAAHLVDHPHQQTTPTNNLTECYTSTHPTLHQLHHNDHHQLLLPGDHHQHQSHHNSQHQHLNLNHQHHQAHIAQHQVNYNQIDHQWLSPTSATDHSSAGIALQFGAVDGVVHVESPTTDQAVRIASPAHHQAIDHVHHYVPLYHHSCYANHSTGQLDSFHQQHIAEDDYHLRDPLALTSSNNSGSIAIESRQQQSNSLAEHQSNHSRMTLNGEQNVHPDNRNNNSSNNNNNNHNLASYEQSHHHGQHQIRHHTQLEHLNLHAHHHHHHHHQHHHQPQPNDSSQHQIYHDSPQNLNHNGQPHHMMTLMNGLEPSAVILQDINLASANWSSPEDLYSI